MPSGGGAVASQPTIHVLWPALSCLHFEFVLELLTDILYFFCAILAHSWDDLGSYGGDLGTAWDYPRGILSYFRFFGGHHTLQQSNPGTIELLKMTYPLCVVS